jgi:hypothetical protein
VIEGPEMNAAVNHLTRMEQPMRTVKVLLLSVALVGASASCEWVKDTFKAKAPDIKFAPYSTGYASKMDLAQIEYKFPLSSADLAKITPGNLAALDQEQVDQIYARLSAGPIPDGPFDGKILFPRGSSGKFRFAELAAITLDLKGLGQYQVGDDLWHLKGLELEKVGEVMWKGKVFYRDERVLRNRIEDISALQKIGLVQGEPKKMALNGKETWLLFPAKLYCGQSLFDSRRESVIIDYFFTDEIKGYQENPDFLAGRRGLRVRDEIRMVRPGFYLGRAYLDKVFGLNFTLYNKEIAERDGAAFEKTGQIKEDCWTGTQQRAVASQ